jgi:dTDP-glucose 4,6-dehydratase
MHILLMGGTGFFGRALLNYWHFSRYPYTNTASISVVSRNPARFLKNYPEYSRFPGVKFYKGDILDPYSLNLPKNITHVIHAASDSSRISNLTPLQVYSQIVDGTRNLLDLSIAIGASRFLYISSGGVYGPQPQELKELPEDWSCSPALDNPANAYGLGKRGAEHLCALYSEAHGLETIVARCFSFVGPDLPLNAHFAIGNFIRDAQSNDAIYVSGDGTAERSYLYQSDLANWLFTLLTLGCAGQTYNIGSNEDVSIAQLAHLVRDELAPSKPVRINANPRIAFNRNRYVPQIRKATEELGLSITIPLKEAIRRTGEAILARNKRD